MNKLTKDELDIMYNLVRDQYDLLMRGDWDAAKDEIAELHLVMHKILVLQGEAK